MGSWTSSWSGRPSRTPWHAASGTFAEGETTQNRSRSLRTSSLTAEERLAGLDQFRQKLGLDAIRRLLAALGRPQDEFPVVLVGGTNGKGSTSALLASMLNAAGYRTGLYTSPHLEQVEERVRINGATLSAEQLGDLLGEVLDTSLSRLGELPTYFEALTAAALLGFRRHAVDIAVLEVGLGGRLDATNATEPVLCIVTPLGLDHQNVLGDTLEEIAGEKAGIFRRDTPVVAYGAPAAAVGVLRARAEAQGAAFFDVLKETAVFVEAPGAECRRTAKVRVSTQEGIYETTVELLGVHQTTNLALAVRSAELLKQRGFSAIDSRAIETGAQRCRWPGRLEWVSLPIGSQVLLDGAHNGPSADALTRYLASLEPHVLLFGSMTKKKVDAVLPTLARHAQRVVLTTVPEVDSHPPPVLAAVLERHGLRTDVVLEPQPTQALEMALDGSSTTVISGSLYLVGAMRRELRRRFGVPEPAAAIRVSG